MTTALSMPLILAAVRALMSYRDRVDRVLSLSTAAEGLPFALPPVPLDMRPYREEMRAFFRTEDGRTILVIHALWEGFVAWDRLLADDRTITDPVLRDNIDKCVELYRRARSIGPYLLQPALKDPETLQRYAESGPGIDARLAYFIVDSDRLSRNSTLTRILLVTADTLLEYLGQNANTFISNTRTRIIVESLIEEFAGKQDFDDYSAQEIFRSLLGAGVAAVLDHTEALPDKRALVALYGAINNVRKEIKEKQGNDGKAYDTLARLFGEGGLERIGRFFLDRVAADTSLVTHGETIGAAIKAVLSEIVAAYDADGTFIGLFADQAARQRILEALVEVGAGRAVTLLERKGSDGRPFSSAVLAALATSVQQETNKHQLFKNIASGRIYGDLFAVGLASVATNPKALSDELEIPKVMAELISAMAVTLEGTSFPENLDSSQRDKLVSAALSVLSKHPEALTGIHGYAGAVLAAALQGAALGMADGFTAEDLEDVVDAALKAAGDNATLAGMADAQAAALKAVTDTIGGSSLTALSTRLARKSLLFAALAAVNASPKVWSSEQARHTLQPLISALIDVLKEGSKRQLLSDSAMVDAFAVLMKAVGTRARGIVARTDASADLKSILLKGLDLAEEELGHTVTQESIPALLERIALAYCKSPFVLADMPGETIDRFFNDIREWLDSL